MSSLGNVRDYGGDWEKYGKRLEEENGYLRDANYINHQVIERRDIKIGNLSRDLAQKREELREKDQKIDDNNRRWRGIVDDLKNKIDELKNTPRLVCTNPVTGVKMYWYANVE